MHIILNLEGVQSNRSAIGTKLKLELETGRVIYYTINTGGSFGANSLQSEIGIGKSELIQKLSVMWPNSHTQNFYSVQVNKKYKLVEGQNKLREEPYHKIELSVEKTIHHHH